MTIKQKIGIGLFLSIVASLALLISPHRALAATITNDDFANAKYTVTNFAPNNKVSTLSLPINGSSYQFRDKDTGDSGNNLKYYGQGFICHNVDGGNGGVGEGIDITGSAVKIDAKTAYLPAKIDVQYRSNPSQECIEGQPNPSTIGTSIKVYFNIDDPNAPPVGGGGGGGGTEEGGTTCESSSSTALEWIMCPLFNIAGDLANSLIGLFESELCFKTDVSPTANTPSCESFNTSKIVPAWSAIKNIVSALLVIVMLLAIISQAFSIGPIDVYTIRKLLPRLIAAVILIQISFYLFSWAINLVNDIGVGINDLLQSIFPAKSNKLADLLANVDPKMYTSTGVFWLGMIAVVGFAIAALPMVLLLLFSAVVAILIGLAVLIFRKVLIVALLLTAPLALLMWVLPNTERYWKMWWENFIKILFMFPIIVLIIEAGRIFAWVAGSASSGFIGVFLVFVGFFGPLFLLPKTYKWGGALMQATGSGAFKFGGRMSEKPSGYFKDRQEGLKAERIRQSQERYSKGEGFKLSRPWRRPLDLARSGQIDPLLLTKRQRQQATTGYAARGAESEEADVKAAEQRLGLMFDEAANHDELARNLAAGGDNITYSTKSGQTRRVGSVSMAERQAALGAVARYGGGTNMRFLDKLSDTLNTGSPEEQVMAEKFRNANSQILLPKMKHLYFASADSKFSRDEAINSYVENGITESAFAGMDTAEMEAILSSLSQRAAGGDGEAAQHLSTVLTSYESAINNSNIRPSIDAGVNKAVEAFVDGANLKPITESRGKVGLGSINPGAAGMPQLAERVSSLKGRIDASGNIRQTPAAPPSE